MTPQISSPLSSGARKWVLPSFACALLLPFLAKLFLSLGLAWPCLFKAMTGLPCATCGGTRALGALSHFDFASALRFNPMVVLSALALVALPVVRYRPNPKVFWPVFWTLVGLNWLYLVFFLPR